MRERFRRKTPVEVALDEYRQAQSEHTRTALDLTDEFVKSVRAGATVSPIREHPDYVASLENLQIAEENLTSFFHTEE